LIAGDSKVGKSTFLFHALLAIVNGTSHIDLKTRPARIMYISEQPYQSLRKQLIEIPELSKYIGNNLKFIPFDNNVVTKQILDPDSKTYKEGEAFPSSWEEQVAVWQKAVNKWSPQVVVLDTYTSFAQLKGGELFDSGPIITKIQQLKSLIINEPELAIVINHHCRKDPQQRGDNYSKSFHDMAGSYGFRAATDVNVMITKPAPESNPTLRKLQIEGRYIENPDGQETLWYTREDGRLLQTDDPTDKEVYQNILSQALTHPEWDTLSLRDFGAKVGKSYSTIKRFRDKYRDLPSLRSSTPRQ
jgi:RecA-family ATPase